jgi:hypothetical protein
LCEPGGDLHHFNADPNPTIHFHVDLNPEHSFQVN